MRDSIVKEHLYMHTKVFIIPSKEACRWSSFFHSSFDSVLCRSNTHINKNYEIK